MNKTKFKPMVIAMFLVISVVATTFGTPVKALNKGLRVEAYYVYVGDADQRDGEDNEEFRVQVKYYDSGWDMAQSSGDIDIDTPGSWYGSKVILVQDVDWDTYIYIRLMERDAGRNDQIIEPYEENSGDGINDGDWDDGNRQYIEDDMDKTTKKCLYIYDSYLYELYVWVDYYYYS